MATYINLDYNNFASNPPIGNGNLSPSLSSEDSNNFDLPYVNDHFIAYKTLTPQESPSSNGYNLPNSLYQMQSNTLSSNNEFSKVDIRRLKNRESAARSRQKIKNKLTTLEKSMVQLEERKDALINEKYLIMHEIENLENQMLTLSLEKMKNSPLGEIKDELVQF